MLKGKKILLGISGGIAAYKSVALIRMFQKKGALVRVVVSHNALKFVTKLTLETISQHKIYADVFEENNEYNTEHVSLTDWADCFVIAPATANIIAKFSSGIADDALSTSFIAFNKAVFLAPAMNTKMYEHFSVQRNIHYLKSNGIEIIEPAHGFLACNSEGKGRMEEPENIVSFIEKYYSTRRQFEKIKVLVTAGPTFERIDPVRFIGNFSTGKMGFAIAEAYAERGADVTLITGPTSQTTSHKNIKRIDIESGLELLYQCLKHFRKSDITIMAAAVADYKPINTSSQKIKSDKKTNLSLKFEPTTDIISELGKIKRESQILIGFALETHAALKNAKDKLFAKKADAIAVNSLEDAGAGFGYDTNKITMVTKKGNTAFPLLSKKDTAIRMVEFIASQFKKK